MNKQINEKALQASLRMIDKKGEIAFEQAKAAGVLTPEQEKFSALISDESFFEKVLAADTAAEARALFLENGLDLSDEELNRFGRLITDLSYKLLENGGELSEEELENVAGGSLFGSILRTGTILGAAGAGAGIGTAICPGVGSCVGLVVGAVGGLWLGCEGHERGWYETAANALSTTTGYMLTGMKITANGAISAAKKLGGWIKSWF